MSTRELITLQTEGKQIFNNPSKDPKIYQSDIFKRWSLKVFELLKDWEKDEFGGGVIGGYISNEEMKNRLERLNTILDRRAAMRSYIDAGPRFKL
jgi:DNA polymerase II small subunit/DNA polymerase delta subunit B